jgi:uncharacterized protein YciI
MQKLAVILAFAALGFLTAADGDDSSGGGQTFGRANPHKIPAFVVLLRLRTDVYLEWKATGKWPSDPKLDQALDGHTRYWEQQLKDGRAVLAGAMGGDFWDNAALVVFEAASLEEAQKIAEADPAVKAYAFQVQVRPFDVFWITNKYGAGTQASGAAVGH